MGYEAYSIHQQGHATSARGDDQRPGPSLLQDGLTLNHDKFQTGSASSTAQTVQVGSGDDPYKIERAGVRTFASTAATETTYRLRFNNQWKGRKIGDTFQQLHHLFEDLLTRARQNTLPNDRLRVVIRHNGLNQSVLVPLQPANEVTAKKILHKIENVLQSEESLSIDDSFQGEFICSFVFYLCLFSRYTDTKKTI